MRHGSQPTANRPPHLVASYDTQGGAEDVFYPDVPTGIHAEEDVVRVTEDETRLVYLSALLTLAKTTPPSRCQVKGCGQAPTVSHKTIGSAIYVTWVC